MPLVTMPDGVTVDMPDNPTPEQLAALEQVHAQRVPEAAKEVGRVVDKGVRKGVTGLPGLIGDVVLSGVRAADKPSSDMVMGSPPAAALRLMTSVFGNPADGTKFGDVAHALETAGGLAPEVSQPKTKTGKGVANVLESMIATVLGGGAGTFGQKAGIGLAGGVGGEGAARLFGDNPVSRFLGSLLGSGVAGVAQSMRPNSDKLVKQATEHVTDADWQKASAIEKILQAEKIPHTKSQLLGPRSTLDDVVATASANPSVRPKLTTAVEGAPKAAEHALSRWTSGNLPVGGPASRSEVLSDVQEAADKALRSVKDKSNAAFVQAMPPKHTEYDQGRVRTLHNSLLKLADDPRFGATTDAGKALQRFADRLVEKREWDVSRVHPVLIARAEAEAKAAGKTLDPSTIPGARQVTTFVTSAHKINNLNKEAKLLASTDDFKGLPISDIRRIMNQATPEFERARAAKEAIMQREFNPASQGLTGQLAKMGGGVKPDKLTAKDTALGIVFNPTQPQGNAIKDMAKTMGGEQVGDLLREHIGRTMQTVLRQEDKSPRSFVQALYESPAQKENIEAALEVTARHYRQNPDAVKIGFRRLMEGLDSFKDLKLASGVSPATTAAQAGQNAVSQAATPLTGTRRFFEQRVTAKTYNEIADLVTKPDGLQKLQAIAKAPDQNTVLQMIVAITTSSRQGGEK